MYPNAAPHFYTLDSYNMASSSTPYPNTTYPTSAYPNTTYPTSASYPVYTSYPHTQWASPSCYTPCSTYNSSATLGAQGCQGERGVCGAKGDTGACGAKGDTGETGTCVTADNSIATSFGAWASGEPGALQTNDNWLPSTVTATTATTLTYTDGVESFLNGSNANNTARALSTASLDDYHLPHSTIPYNARLQHISWVWNGYNPISNTYSAPNFDVDIKIYIYAGFSDDKVPNDPLTYTYTWDATTGSTSGVHVVTDTTIITNLGQGSNERSAVSVSIQGKQGTATIDATATPAEYVQWKGSFSIGLGFVLQ